MHRLTVVGVGRMGTAICARLVEVGFEVRATDLLPARRAEAEAAGARWAEGLEPAATGADIVVTVLPGPPEVSTIARPLTTAMAGGALWVDLSTASPPVAETARTSAERRDIALVDAPLGGSPEDARNGRLLCFAAAAMPDARSSHARGNC